MSSFRDLKTKRDARLNPNESQSTSNIEQEKPQTTSSEVRLYTELQSADVEIKASTNRGRGLSATSSFRPGSKLLSVTPHVYVLSSGCLETHCSTCTLETRVRRCTQCLKVSYCSAECQKEDWKLHKEECKALIRWSAASPGNTAPADAVRVLGRLLWSRKIRRPSSSWWVEVQAMQSNRESLSLATQEAFTHLAQAIVMYLDIQSPEGLQDMGINSPKELVDFMSKFTSNSFTLTSPTLDPIGVAISPLPALINHSCQPNAVILFPRPAKSKRPNLQVIAIAPIGPGEEIESAYVDITIPREERQKMLQETYSFTCQCTECSRREGVDPRECILCLTCHDGLVSTIGDGHRATCTKCRTDVTISNDIKDKLRVANEGLEKADSLQRSDPGQALRLANNLTALIAPFSPPSSHPRLALMRTKHSLLISEMEAGNTSVDEVIRNAAQVVAGLMEVLAKGHPLRGIAIAELGKLLCVDEPASAGDAKEEDAFPPRGYQRLVLARDTLIRAKDEIEIGFGPGGGALGDAMRSLLENTDREIAIYRRGVKSLKASTSK